MIRPVTCLTMLLAAGSGLYLYQAKHQAYVLDGQIATVLRETAKVHAHIAVLRAEFALMNDPSRLQALAATHLPNLAPLAPGQFTTMAQLDWRLPAIAAPTSPPPPQPVAEAPAATGHAVYDHPPAPAAAPIPAVVASLAAPAAAPTAASSPAHTFARTIVAAHHPRAKVYASAPRTQTHRVTSLATMPASDPLAIQAAAPPADSPARVASALGMARGLLAPAVAYQPADGPVR